MSEEKNNHEIEEVKQEDDNREVEHYCYLRNQ